MDLRTTLDIRPGVTAIIGGGGKTTLLYALGKELSQVGKVILCTTTKILPPTHLPLLTGAVTPEEVSAALEKSPQICIGTLWEQRKLAEPEMEIGQLAKLADYVIVEADGAARKPVKAHASHEPVIPPETNNVIYVVGMDGVGVPIEEKIHRPELFAQLAGCAVTDLATPERIAKVMLTEHLFGRVLFNKAESPEAQKTAAKIAGLLHCPAAVSALEAGWCRPLSDKEIAAAQK